MKSTCTHSFENYFSGQMTPSEVQEFERHLESCTTCQEQLQLSAADPQSWFEAKRYLSVASSKTLSNTTQVSASFSDADIREDESAIAEQALSLLAPTDEPNMLGRIGAYEISGVIGAGGMGIVLKGWDRALNRVVAVKLMAPHLATSGVAKSRFLREAQAAAGIVHPNVIDIYGVAEFGTLPYLVMPYVRGCSLQKRVQTQGPLPVEDVVRIGLQIASGLSAAHSQGIIHRDIKPANILVGDGVDRVIITDFGLARTVDDASLTRTGMLAGTPQYMSPEQAKGERIDERSDLFSLGSVLYFLATGHPPYRAETVYGTLQRIAVAQARDMREIQSNVPDWLQRFVARLHEVDPSRRYESASRVASLLEQCLAHYQHPLKHTLPIELMEPPTESSALKQPALAKTTLRAGLILGSLILASLLSAWMIGEQWIKKPAKNLSLQLKSDSASSHNHNAPANPQLPSEDRNTGLAKDELQYRFQLGKTIGYLLTLTAEERQDSAIILIKPFAIREDTMELAISTTLDTRTSNKSSMRNESASGTSVQWSSSYLNTSGNQNLTAIVTINTKGKSRNQLSQLQLPYELGSPIQYVLPELNLNALPLFRSGNRCVALRGGSSAGEFVFDLDAGQIASFSLDSWGPEPSPNHSNQIPFQFRVTKLNNSDVEEWLQFDGNTSNHQKAPSVVSDEELTNCTAELSEGKRIVFWLRHLDLNSVNSFPNELVDVVRELCRDSNPLYLTLAMRLMHKIPPPEENPFKVQEPE